MPGTISMTYWNCMPRGYPLYESTYSIVVGVGPKGAVEKGGLPFEEVLDRPREVEQPYSLQTDAYGIPVCSTAG